MTAQFPQPTMQHSVEWEIWKRNLLSTICCLTNWYGCSTMFTRHSAQSVAVCLKPAPGNQAGKYCTDQLLERKFRWITSNKIHTRRNEVDQETSWGSWKRKLLNCNFNVGQEGVIALFNPVTVGDTHNYSTRGSTEINEFERDKLISWGPTGVYG